MKNTPQGIEQKGIVYICSKEAGKLVAKLEDARSKSKDLRIERNRLAASLKEIKQRSANRMERIKDAAQQLEKYILGSINSEIMADMDQRDFASLMSRLKNPAGKKDVDAVMSLFHFSKEFPNSGMIAIFASHIFDMTNY